MDPDASSAPLRPTPPNSYLRRELQYSAPVAGLRRGTPSAPVVGLGPGAPAAHTHDMPPPPPRLPLKTMRNGKAAVASRGKTTPAPRAKPTTVLRKAATSSRRQGLTKPPHSGVIHAHVQAMHSEVQPAAHVEFEAVLQTDAPTESGLNMFDEMIESDDSFLDMMTDAIGIEDFAMPADPFEENIEGDILEIPTSTSKKWAHGGNYSTAEDEALVLAWQNLNYTQELYKQREPKHRPFVMLHCWALLQHNEKWVNRNNDPHPLKKRASSDMDSEGCGDDDGSGRSTTPSSERPPRRKQEKERLKRGGDALVFHSAVHDMITCKKEMEASRKVDKQARWDYLASLQERVVSIQQEKLSVKKMKQQNEIMFKDLSGFDKTQLAYDQASVRKS